MASADQHYQDGYHNGGDHDRELVHHANDGYHRAQREDQVEGQDLDEHPGEGGPRPGDAVVPFALQVVVDLEGALAQEEEAAADQD
jgi:hypothetical protein